MTGKKRPLRDLPESKKAPPGWLRPVDAAKAWNLSEEAVHALIRRGRLEAVRVYDGKVPHTVVNPNRPTDLRSRR